MVDPAVVRTVALDRLDRRVAVIRLREPVHGPEGIKQLDELPIMNQNFQLEDPPRR
jgi:hypothetical protein